jgi:hypothetical protein
MSRSLTVLELNEKNKSKINGLMPKFTGVIRYHMTNCGFCNMMKPEWNKAIRQSKDTNTQIIDIERSSISMISPTNKSYTNVFGFPYIVLYKNGIRKKEFNDNRDADNFMKFFKEGETPKPPKKPLATARTPTRPKKTNVKK